MHDFKSLRVWNEAIDLVSAIYLLTQSFPQEEMFGLTQQIRRSAVSIPGNIAEGACRNSQKEFYHFLGISNGSAGELQTQLIIAAKLGYGKEEEITILIERTESIKK